MTAEKSAGETKTTNM